MSPNEEKEEAKNPYQQALPAKKMATNAGFGLNIWREKQLELIEQKKLLYAGRHALRRRGGRRAEAAGAGRADDGQAPVSWE